MEDRGQGAEGRNICSVPTSRGSSWGCRTPGYRIVRGLITPTSQGWAWQVGGAREEPSLLLWTALHPVFFEFLHLFPMTPLPASPLTSPFPSPAPLPHRVPKGNLSTCPSLCHLSATDRLIFTINSEESQPPVSVQEISHTFQKAQVWSWPSSYLTAWHMVVFQAPQLPCFKKQILSPCPGLCPLHFSVTSWHHVSRPSPAPFSSTGTLSIFSTLSPLHFPAGFIQSVCVSHGLSL